MLRGQGCICALLLDLLVASSSLEGENQQFLNAADTKTVSSLLQLSPRVVGPNPAASKLEQEEWRTSCIAATGARDAHIRLVPGDQKAGRGAAAAILLHASVPNPHCIGQCNWQLSRPLTRKTNFHLKHPGWNKASFVLNISNSKDDNWEEGVISAGWLVRGQNIIHLPPAFSAAAQTQQPLTISIFCQGPGSAWLCQPLPSRVMISMLVDEKRAASSLDDNSTVFTLKDVPSIFPGHVHTAEVLVLDPYADRFSTHKAEADPEHMGNGSVSDRGPAELRRRQPDSGGQHVSMPKQQGGLWAGRVGLVLWIIGVGWARDFAARQCLPGCERTPGK
ncbi:hypothetical protein DUNSADRAFT_11667 [Dunaliella salina]|uniref:Encoded protein n=1 Tax=Dunaliella salina TaxID=3046 RepID=A0ABQ7GCX4_DUNSA|nr:hypothetical protein DUNSADRAFT_11667 [Dunaliella salina]|eukprot:KAF5832440.1 hypothetical protein DUNSADRAFT_11667 [Dunaliella salina]